ncbi:hypothetical protein [Nocardia niwae]|uniref:hypothetical protein n=1 Tax=Nocardia niwae TaxID=626084 RepID=UPI000A8FE61E|nr:hypothetical protein [Nocardia niwae]
MKYARVWDSEWNLLHAFEPDEDHTRLPLSTKAARSIYYGPEKPVFITVDEGDGESSTRWSGRLVAAEPELRTGEDSPVLALTWAEDPPAKPLVPIPDACDIEIVERTKDDRRDGGHGVLCPNSVRINGTPVLVPADSEVIVHPIGKHTAGASNAVMVTLTVFARSVSIHHETDSTPQG